MRYLERQAELNAARTKARLANKVGLAQSEARIHEIQNVERQRKHERGLEARKAAPKYILASGLTTAAVTYAGNTHKGKSYEYKAEAERTEQSRLRNENTKMEIEAHRENRKKENDGLFEGVY